MCILNQSNVIHGNGGVVLFFISFFFYDISTYIDKTFFTFNIISPSATTNAHEIFFISR
jgi:hypothetical protein